MEMRYNNGNCKLGCEPRSLRVSLEKFRRRLVWIADTGLEL